MNIVKIQTDLLKDALNGKAHKWFIQHTASDVLILTEYQMYAIDHKEYVLNTGKLYELGVKDLTTAERLLDGYKNAKPLVKTPLKRVVDKYTCIELKLGEESIYLNEALLKNYDKNVEFEGTSAKAPVYLYEGEILVGLVLPVRVV